jgi:hypothetical protein
MTALSIRIEPELEEMLSLEVKRLKTTRSKFIQNLLTQALAPKDAYALLMKAHAQFGIEQPDLSIPRTNNASNVKALVKAAIEEKHRNIKQNGLEDTSKEKAKAKTKNKAIAV